MPKPISPKAKKAVYVLLTVLLLSVAVSLIDAVVKPPYALKVPIKIFFFLLVPMSFFLLWRDEFPRFRALFTFRKKGLLLSLLLGVGVYAVILGGFFLTRNLIDYSGVTSSLTEGMGITAENFLFVSLYISLANSFLEEFFFRGYGFITLKELTGRRTAYLFSAAVFAVYHVGMLLPMFHPAVLLLLLVGLIVGGCIFNYMNERCGNLYASWFVHMFANFAINTVGFLLFGIL